MDKWLLNNTSTKIIAILLAVLLFIVVHKDDAKTAATKPVNDTTWINQVKIEVVGLDEESLVIRDMSKDRVSVQVQGKKAKINALRAEQFKVVLDLSGYGAGQHMIQLNYEFPDGITVETLVPSVILVELEEVQKQQFEVEVKTKGTPKEGYTAGTPIIRPSNQVHVNLPATRMSKVKSVSAVVNIDKATESVIEKQVKLTAYDSEGKVMNDAVITPAVVEVEVPVTKPFKSVPLQLKFSGDLPPGMALEAVDPEVNVVTLYGDTKVLAGIEFYDQVDINVSELATAGTHTVNVKLTPPPNIEKMEPSTIDVKVTIAEATERVITNVPITLTGESDKLHTSITEPASRKHDVTVVGASKVIGALTAKDIQLIANVNDLPTGIHTITLQVNLPRFVRLVNPGSLIVTVLITDKDKPVDVPPITTPEDSPDSDAGTDIDPTPQPPSGSEEEGQPTEDIPSTDGPAG